MTLSGQELLRFNKCIDKSSGCWLWKGTRNDKGYGYFWIKGKSVGAHRLSYCIANGIPFTNDVYIMHKCDNPPCVNPGYLERTTHKANMEDAAEKGLFHPLRGSMSLSAKLTEDDVVSIRKVYASGRITFAELGKIYGVAGISIRHAVRGITWAHIQ